MKSKNFDKNSEIHNTEFLYRPVRYGKLFWSKRYDLPAITAFQDSDGLSVERSGDQDEQEKIDFFKKHRYTGVLIKLNCGKCREINTYPVPKPSKRSDYHSEIHDSPNQELIQVDKCEELAKISEKVVNL